ncbi:hypothetical protein [Geodermatophilus sp. URMC 64]
MSQPPAPAAVSGRWMHSFEEDHGDVAVYRPAGYQFPRARGRDGIEFAEDGSFTRWAVGRGDARRPVPGQWRPAPSGRLEVSTDEGSEVLEVVHVDADRLELRKESAT